MTGTDDFIIALDEPEDLESCGIEVFDGFSQLWKLVQRYRMKTPLTIDVIDGQSICIRRLKAVRDTTGIWKLTDETQRTSAPFEDKPITFPLVINSKDLSGNILKMRVELSTKGPLPRTPDDRHQESENGGKDKS